MAIASDPEKQNVAWVIAQLQQLAAVADDQRIWFAGPVEAYRTDIEKAVADGEKKPDDLLFSIPILLRADAERHLDRLAKIRDLAVHLAELLDGIASPPDGRKLS